MELNGEEINNEGEEMSGQYWKRVDIFGDEWKLLELSGNE